MQRTKKHSSIPREYPLPRLYTSVSTKEESLKVEADWHDYYELIYFQEGSFQLYLNLKEIHIEEECLILIPKGCVHRRVGEGRRAFSVFPLRGFLLFRGGYSGAGILQGFKRRRAFFS